MPPKSTYYYCELFVLPKFNNPVHLIQFEILTNPKTKKNFHHVSIFQCDGNFEASSSFSQECGAAGVPNEISFSCMQILIVAWGIGGQYVIYFSHLLLFLFSKYLLRIIASQKKLDIV